VANNSKALSNKTVLKDRVLYYDGDVEIFSKDFESWLYTKLREYKILVNEITPEIEEFNRSRSVDSKIKIKDSLRDFDFSWRIPESYKSLNVENRIWEALAASDTPNEELHDRIVRIKKEIAAFERLNLLDFLRTLCFIVDSLKNKGILWGVGRGSSVASYCLFLLEIHDVDSFKFDLDFEEFVKHS